MTLWRSVWGGLRRSGRKRAPLRDPAVEIGERDAPAVGDQVDQISEIVLCEAKVRLGCRRSSEAPAKWD